MSNTITAYFKGRVGVAESVYQNDYGIVMAFDSIVLPAHFDCYFSRLNQEEALPGLGADNRVTIPNSILANPGNVTIHIPLHTGEDDSEVEYVIYFKVIGRARPIDDGTPAQMTAIERALALLSQPITNIEEIVNEALSFTGDTFAEMKQELQDDFDNYTETLEGDLATWKGGVESDIEGDLATWKGGVESDIDDVEADFDVLQAQFDTAVGAVTTDTEVTDIRVGADGITDTTAGASVRRQFTDVKIAVSDLMIDDYSAQTAVFEDIKSSMTKNAGKFISYSGTAISEGSSALWNYYSLSASVGDRFKITTYQDSTIKAVYFLDSNNVILAKYPTTYITSLEQDTFDIKAPSGTARIIVNERTESAKVATIKQFSNYQYSHTDEYKSWKAKQSSILTDAVKVDVPLADITEKDGYFLINGVETASSLWRIMSIDVVAGEKYQVAARYYSDLKCASFFDAEDNFLSAYGSSSDDTLHTIDVTIPDDAVKMSINDKKSDGFAVKKYINPINNDFIIINNKTIQEIVDSFGYSGNVLYGKVLVTSGDSITQGADMDSPGISPTGELMTYGWQIANRNSMTFVNDGVSGSTVASGTGRSGFAEENGRYTQLPEHIDYLTLWFGWNDGACISDNLETLGTIDSTDRNSFYGAYNVVLPYLINKYPNARIGLVVPFGGSAAIRQAVRDLGEKWGLSYFDNYKGDTPLYFGKEDESVLASGLISARRAVWQANGAHPSYAGHCQLATQIEAWLRTL